MLVGGVMFSFPMWPKWPKTRAVRRQPPVVVREKVVPERPFVLKGTLIMPIRMPMTAQRAKGAIPKASSSISFPGDLRFSLPASTAESFFNSCCISAWVSLGISWTNRTTPITP